MKTPLQIILIILFGIFLFESCGQVYVPKPYGYFRVDMPESKYRRIDTLSLPYSFDLSSSAVLLQHTEPGKNHWIDLYYPKLNAKIYCTYIPVRSNLTELTEDTHRYVYKHSIKADGISEKVFVNSENNLYGVLYDIKGNTASSVQFVITDSSRHFFRGALYFDNVPNKDSIAPMVEFVRRDILRLIESFEWKK